jgi:hypothetical protein
MRYLNAPISPRFFIVAAMAAALSGFVPFLAAQPAADLRPIFDGKDLTGWKAEDHPGVWKVRDGVLCGENDETLAGSMLWTEKSYGDVVIEVETRWDASMDSGIFVRKPALQMQIGTSVSLKRDMTGSFYIPKGGYIDAGQAKDAAKYLKMGEWNTLRLEARGAVFTVWINGHLAAKYTDPAHAEAGPIGVQVHPKVKGKVEFRNIRVAELH